MLERIPLGKADVEPGTPVKKMKAVVVRPDRLGDPIKSMKVEEVDVPEPGPGEVLVYVKAAGVNFDGVWAALGKPINVMKYTGYDFHIAGSDASGIVWKVGPGVKNVKVGDKVVIHCNQSCGQCPQCNGLDPMACEEQKIWGYESNWGSFAQFCLVQAQQILPKPKHLSWVEAASYPLTYFTAWRMLVKHAEIKPGDVVLIWGAAGGLGIFATQICLISGATPVCVVSSPEKSEILKSFGAKLFINRKDFDIAPKNGKIDEKTAKEMKKFRDEIRRLTGGKDPDIVFEHVGQETFPTSVFVVDRFGKVVICGATTGYNLMFDVRHLWVRQKKIIGSHFANAYDAHRANELVMQKKIKTFVSKVFEFEETPLAHQLMYENKHYGKMVVKVQVEDENEGREE
ncbi:MAG: crotonyl-CoA carboxylase/reductase [Candidatus Calescibacterium sp.]|nr:crotonyl-CoA carboxylase/reductase [Candidatus Calescibacterium sp.]MCX7734297.1 crotonyl-CoA carboxylase/reductase [bacterium]MDW8087128.1 crotonyl-CoA carboxylase/reductase [Candidatus Calescibacterium sp.]